MDVVRRAVALVVAALIAFTTLLAMQATSAGAGDSGRIGDAVGFAGGSSILWGSDTDLARDLDVITATGARWLRLDFDWPSAEPVQGQFNWRHIDRVVTAAQARGLRILALPTYTPRWARPTGTSDKHAPSDPRAFAAFAAAAAARYAPQGVHAWEVWNEPNLDMFWQPRPDPAAYTTLLKEAAAAIRVNDPQATIVSGGLSPALDARDGSTIAPRTFLNAMYDHGAASSFDAVGIHPYAYPFGTDAAGDWNTFSSLPKTYQVMVAHGDGAKKLWGTEYGAPTGASSDAVSEFDQTAYTTKGIDTWMSWPFTGPLFWYAHRDTGTDPADREQNFGLVREDFRPKAALATFTSQLARPMTTERATNAATPPLPLAPPAQPVRAGEPGYVLVGADGGVHGFGGAAGISGGGRSSSGSPVVGVASTPGSKGWSTAADGAVLSFGGAPAFGSLAGRRLAEPVAGISGTTTGGGYWLVARDGGIFAFGDAAFYGSTGGTRLNQPIVGMAATPSGRGYWLVARDGGIFAFGDAAFHGSTGATRLNQPIVAMAATPSGKGYWLVARDGGIFAFGDAAFFGSTGGIRLNQPVVGMGTAPAGMGYWLVAKDGGVFSFGTARFLGSMAGRGVDVAGVATAA